MTGKRPTNTLELALDQVERPGGLCSAHGCPRGAGWWRVPPNGLFLIGYCLEHFEAAKRFETARVIPIGRRRNGGRRDVRLRSRT